MTISIKSVAVGTTDGSSTSVAATSAETSATVAGDLVVVIHCNDFYTLANMATPTATGSPTLTLIGDSDVGTNNAHIKAWWYEANTNGAQHVTVTETGTADEEKAIVVYVLGGAATTSPVDGTPAADGGTDTGQTAQPCDSVTTSNAGSLLFNAICSGGGSASTGANSYTPPAGVTKDEEWHPDTFFSGASGHKLLSSAGASGIQTWTVGGSRFASLAFAIKAAAGGSDHAGAVTPTVTATLAPTATHIRPAAAAGTAVATLAPTPHQGHGAAISSAVTVGLAPAATHIRGAAIAATATATLAPAVTQDHTAATPATVTATLAAGATPVHPAAVTADVVPALFLSPSGHNQGAIAADITATLEAAETHTRVAAVALTAVATLIGAASSVGAHAISSTVIARMAATILANIVRDITVTYGQPELAWAFGPPELAWHLGTVET